MREELSRVASRQRYLISRQQVLDVGATDRFIEGHIAAGKWRRIHDGVYQVDTRPLDWESRLLAAVLASGPTSLVSHRSAWVLWGLDGLQTSIIELTTPFTNHPIPAGVHVHRTRRPLVGSEVREIPVTTVERTLLDCAAFLPRLIIAKGLDYTIRHGLTTVEKVYDLLVARGGRGVRGTKALRWVLRERLHETATGSGSEFELLYHMQMAFLPRPELQHELFARSGRRVPDFYWPAFGKAVEVDGVDAHSSADRLDDDLKRQNELMSMGIELRRFSAREVRRNPDGVVSEIRQFLGS